MDKNDEILQTKDLHNRTFSLYVHNKLTIAILKEWKIMVALYVTATEDETLRTLYLVLRERKIFTHDVWAF